MTDSTPPTTAAGRRLVNLWIADTELPQLDWLALKKAILAIEAEARQQDGSALVRLMENEGVVEWGDERHRERFLAALPPSAPPALDLDELVGVIHDATPPELDGGVPDVCNRYPEHEAIARAILARLERDR